MKRKNLLLTFVSTTMLFSLVTLQKSQAITNELEPDNVTYDDPLNVNFANPSIVRYDAVKSAQAISIHYHNDDANCNKREFWIWCPAADGAAFTPVVSADHKDMVVSFEFTGEYASFAKQPSLSFIVKYVGTWDGQSENVLVSYEDFEPDASGLTEIWTVPGEGNAIEVYKTEADTKMDRFLAATFLDWKTIEVIATDVPSKFKLYALTTNYMKVSAIEVDADKILEGFKIAEGANPTCTNVTYNSVPAKRFEIRLNYTAKINVQYKLAGNFPNYATYLKEKYVSSHKLYETDRFREYYTYYGDDLGATYNGPESTTFKVWAPSSARVRVLVYKSGTPASMADPDAGIDGSDAYGGYDMAFRPGGIWEVTIQGKDLNGSYYNYYVVNSLGKITATDPYAKACGVNGLRGMILDFDTTNPEGWEDIDGAWDNKVGYDIANPNDLSIYETHIRDVTMDETWTGKSERGTYAAFSERGTTYTRGTTTVTTGFDHIEEMGVKAVQLEPVFDSDNSEDYAHRAYNWGYNPLNYNCVEGSYATDPYDGAARIKEYKQLIYNFATNKNKTRIIMDVVYNHVNSAPGSCFNKLMPKYYFRYTETGEYWNGSGCGNEVKTEAPMMSKYIVDSLCWWAKEYNIKGFRFDLMGLIDFQTMKKAAQALYEIDPDIYLYGEGWTGDGQDAHIDNAKPSDPYYGNWGSNTWTVYNKLWKDGDMCYIGAFNNAGRNAIKGDNNFDNKDEFRGFISEGAAKVGGRSGIVADMMVGYHTGTGGNPNQCVNYASCHDNYALFDQLSYTVCNNGQNDYPGSACAAVAAVECTILFSNGAAFIQGGEELFRSKVVSEEEMERYGMDNTVYIAGKYVSHNSYRSYDSTNAYKWDRKISVTENNKTVQVLDYVRQIQKAVKTRALTQKYSYEDLQGHDPYSSESPMNVWGQGDGSTTIGMKNNDFFFFLSGFDAKPIPFDAYFYATGAYNKQIFCSNPKSGGFTPDAGTKSLQLGWYTCVCLSNKEVF